MLKFTELSVCNFGPYKGRQKVKFPAEDGVVVVYGDNMRGKTSLLNAFRYALYGRVVGRGSREIELKKVENWEAVAEGDYGLETALSFAYEGSDYELQRSWRPRISGGKKVSSTDYQEEVFLKRDGTILSPTERQRELDRVMPESISRFFLFDGELLQEYEELLREESEMGYRIKEAIERILGVPVLKKARAHVEKLHGEAQKKLSEAAQREKRTQEIGNHLQNLQERREQHRKNIAEARERIQELEQGESNLRQEMRRLDKYSGLLAERDALRDDLERLKGSIGEQRQRLKEALRGGWLALLQPMLRDLRARTSAERDHVQSDLVERQLAEQRLKHAERGIAANRCPTCGQELDGEARKLMERGVKRAEEVMEQTEPAEILGGQLRRLGQQVDMLTDLGDLANPKLIAQVGSDLDGLEVQRVEKEARVREIDAEFEGLDQSEVREAETELKNIVKRLTLENEGLKKEEALLGEVQQRISKLTAELERSGGGSLEKYKQRKRLFDGLQGLFEDSIAAYRERLRKQVERDASNLFLRLTTEPDYSRLAINENYGLTIIHKSGDPIPVRSAGAEHVVALSLMGALQRNAPLRGPIIMDSPFGRLDSSHTRNVVRSLPIMASQTMLLVFESELDPQLVREELGSHLFCEYRMERRSAKHTQLLEI